MSVAADVLSFNIFDLASNSMYKHIVFDWFYESMAAIDHDQTPYPRLAESWVFDEETLTVDIQLRQGVLFHDGYELTAEDVVFTYTALRDGTTFSDRLNQPFDEDGDSMVSLAEIESSVYATGAYGIRMQMSRPYSQFFANTLTVPIIPEHIWQDHIDPVTKLVNVQWNNDPDALIGTGPFRYAGGVEGEYRDIARFDDYWGKGFVTPDGYNTYPPSVEGVHFEIIPSIDSAIRALKAGELDHIAESIVADRLSAIDNDPGVCIEYTPDAGYFYLAFNEKKEPFGSIAFRQAVSHLIDKPRLVDVYMGGLGIEGTTAVPPSMGEWHNEEVVDYAYDDPDDPASTIPESILDAAGFVDADGDGWRDLPDGTPMEKMTILAPPEDYDPIRIRTAEMIAHNLVKVGINVEALEVNFNTLVSKMMTFEYQMFILGFRFGGYSEGVSILFDIFGPGAASNNWAFWSDENPNPYYSDLGAVSTLADEETMALVDEFSDLESIARNSFDVPEQISAVRQGQEVLAEAVPVNILYHRINALATRAEWTGWVPHMGTLFNMFSLSELAVGEMDRTYQDAAIGLNVGLSAPKTVILGQAASGYVQVIDDGGGVAPGANVAFSFEQLSSGAAEVSIEPSAGETGLDGRLSFTVTASSECHGVLRATASDGLSTDEDSMTLSFVPAVPTTLSLAALLESSVIMPGEATDILIEVRDEYGLPVEGADVVADDQLLSSGVIDLERVTTNGSGHAAMTYTAAPTLSDENGHDLERILLSVSKDGYQHTTSTELNLLVYNDAPPDWTVVKVSSVTTTALSLSDNTATITVEAVCDEGYPMVDWPLTVGYSDESYISAPVTEIVTDSYGSASFDVVVAPGAPTGAFEIVVKDVLSTRSAPASIKATYLGAEAPTAEMYGGYITFDEATQFMPSMGTLHATAHVWDSAGMPAECEAALVVSASSRGSIVCSDETVYDSLWDYSGIVIATSADQVDIATSGPFAAAVETIGWPAEQLEGVDIVSGELDFLIYGTEASMVDILGGIVLVPEAYAYFDWMTLNYFLEGQTMITSGYGYGRSYEVLSASIAIEKPVMTAFNDVYDTSSVSTVVRDQDGVAVPDAVLMVGQLSEFILDSDYYIPELGPGYSSAGPVVADADGCAEFTLVAVGYDYVPTDTTAEADVFAVPSATGTISLVAQSQITIHPQRTSIESVPVLAPALMDGEVVVMATVKDAENDPLVYQQVSMYAGVDETVCDFALTGTDGSVQFTIDVSGITDSDGGFVPVTFYTGGPGYDFSAARLMVPLQSPELTVARLPGSPSLSSVERCYAAGEDSVFAAMMEVNGLRGLVVEVYDITHGEQTEVARVMMSFKGNATAVAEMEPVNMYAAHEYLVVFVPLGPEGGLAEIEVSLAPA